MIQKGNWNSDLPFIVIIPQRCWSDVAQPQTEILNHLVEWTERNYPIDSSRIYMTGLSMGAWATWEYMRTYPDKLAAATPMAGPGWNARACEFSNIPTWAWAFTAKDDATVPYNDVLGTVESMRACGSHSDPKITIFHSGGHVINDNVFDLSYLNEGQGEYDIYEQSIYDWYLEHSKPMP